MKSNFLKQIQQSIRYFKLDLSGYNILLPNSLKKPSLLPLMANMAGAREIYVYSHSDLEKENTYLALKELNLKNNFYFIDKLTPHVLKSVDIVIKGDEININEDLVSSLKRNSVISLYPGNLDFINTSNIDKTLCSEKQISVVAINPADYCLMLYRYFAHIIIKRCYAANLDVFRSRLLLIGNGELMENSLSLLKMTGAQVYAIYTDKQIDKDYIIKHLPEMDGIVLLDYPQKSDLIIGKNGIIEPDEIYKINPEVKIIHLCGNIEQNLKISCVPQNVTQNSPNININEMGLRSIIETSAAVLKAAETLINKTNSIQQKESIVSYDIVNKENSIAIENIIF
ncbi:MAG: hypothetical protein PHV68_02145 [Candidatus Gastranaerophilales bacterium]|nr:hypothetical protein [Candidatus Gastranaerophilales bacterium]